MIVLDTNVVSELVRPRPDPRVMTWLESCDEAALFISTVTVAEMFSGANRMDASPASDRRAHIILDVLDRFRSRTLAFGMLAATECANITSSRISEGRPIGLADAMIAATAVAGEADAIATRDRDFTGVGIRVVDPWAGA